MDYYDQKYILWVGDFSNEINEIFVYKCLTIDQNIINSDIDNGQIHQHKQTCWKKLKQIVNFNILNHQ
jgi:hypothetical protein